LRAGEENILTLQKFVQSHFVTNKKLPFEIQTIKFKKNSILLAPGEIEKNIYFLSSGIVESSIPSSKNQTKIYDFAFTGQFFCSLSSFITQEPTDLTFTCLTNCTIDIIAKESFDKALEKSVFANKFMKYFYEYIYLLRVQKERDLLTLTAKERYLKLIKTHPEIVQQIPIWKVAKYLGVHPRSLSRLRRTAN
jgi:CRP-like cAMP-binding protein